MKIILLYVTLVGILLLGLLGILRVGEKLNAPLNVSGEYEINSEFVNIIDKSCTPLIFHKEEPQLTVEQSGIYLTAKFNDVNKTEMSGKLENNKMIFSQVIQAKKDAAKVCGSEIKAELSVNIIQSDTAEDEIAGTWNIPDCGTSAKIKFSAVKKQED
jgi:hypothetical protein